MVWIVAEHLGLSGILTIVAYAITIARTAPARTPARLRVPSYAVWETVVFVLNVLAFMLIGLQLRPIWTRLDAAVRWEYCVVAACSCSRSILVAHRLGDVLHARAAAADRARHLSSARTEGRSPRSRAASWSPGAACAASSRWRPPLRCRRTFRYRDLIALHRVRGGAGLAGDPGPDAAAADPGAAA